jgi:hypothetical protein
LNPVFHKEIFSTLLLVPSLFDANIILSIQFPNTLNPCPSTLTTNSLHTSYYVVFRLSITADIQELTLVPFYPGLKQ